MSQAGPINELGVIPPEVATIYETNSGDAVPAANILQVLGSGSITTSGSGNVITIALSGSGFTWNTITSADNVKQILVGNGYVTAGVSQCVLLLPLVAAVGDEFEVTGYTSLFQITQNANQSILFGINTTTTGVGGSLTSTSFGDHVSILCLVANLVFKVIDSQGNLTVV